jgi:trehalose monomycolate/heme transporter
MLTNYGVWLYRVRGRMLLFALVLLLGAGVFGIGVFNQLKGSGGYATDHGDAAQAQQILNTKLGGANADVVILMRNSSLRATDPDFAQTATDLLARLQGRAEVASITSYYSTHSVRFLSRDGHETFAIVQLKGQDLITKLSQYQTLEPLITSSGLQITIGGFVPINLAVNTQINEDLVHAELFTFPILAILLLFVFGSVVAALLPLLIGGVAILGAFAVLHVMTFFTDVSSYAVNVLTMLGLGLAIDYALFMITRFREELAGDESDVQGALARTLATAGRTIIFSALIVSTSLLSLLIFPLSFLRSIGLGAIAAIFVVMLSSLTLLPAILALLGKRINALSFGHLFRRKGSNASVVESSGAWYHLSEGVMRRSIPVALVVLAILLTLGWPFLHIKFATSDANVLPPGQEARVVSEQLSQDFVQQGNAQLVIAITAPGSSVLSSANLTSLDQYVQSIQAIAGVKHVDSLVTVSPALTLSQYQQLYAHPGLNPQVTQVADQLANRNFTKVSIALQPAERSAAAITIVNKVRALAVPGGLKALVDGVTPEQMDLLTSLRASLPAALLIIVVSIFVLLFLMTGSLIMPLKAILLNILSLSATFGGLVWIFQDGHLQNVLGFQSLGSIDATQPILIFAIAFGLSMDYEVFLLSRIKERFDQTGDNRRAISSGIQHTGRLITSAALLLAVVLGAFGTAKIIFIQEIGIGLAIAVIVDATLIRMLLVPATMNLMGNLNWWAPAPLRWLWQRIGLSETSPASTISVITPDVASFSEEYPQDISIVEK